MSPRRRKQLPSVRHARSVVSMMHLSSLSPCVERTIFADRCLTLYFAASLDGGYMRLTPYQGKYGFDMKVSARDMAGQTLRGDTVGAAYLRRNAILERRDDKAEPGQTDDRQSTPSTRRVSQAALDRLVSDRCCRSSATRKLCARTACSSGGLIIFGSSFDDKPHLHRVRSCDT